MKTFNLNSEVVDSELSSEHIASQERDLGVVKLVCDHHLRAHKLEKANCRLEEKQQETTVFLYIHTFASSLICNSNLSTHT